MAGFSLIEMLVALSLGGLVLGAAVAWAGRHLGEHQRAVLELQLQQDLRAIAATIQRQLRPLGQLERPEDAAGPTATSPVPDRTNGANGANSSIRPAAASMDGDAALRIEDRGRRLLFRRATVDLTSADNPDTVDDGGAPPVEASATDGGFRLASDRLSQLMGGRYQPLNDPALLRITAFRAELLERPRPLPELCATACPPDAGDGSASGSANGSEAGSTNGSTTGLPPRTASCQPVLREQALRLSIQGQSARDTGVRHTLEWLTVLPNSRFEGACP